MNSLHRGEARGPLSDEVEPQHLPRDADLGGEPAHGPLMTGDVFAEVHRGCTNDTERFTCQPPDVTGSMSRQVAASGAISGPMSDAPKNWLPHFIAEAGTNPNKLANAAGMNRQTMYKLVRRKDHVPDGWAEQLAPLLGTTKLELMFGPGTAAQPSAASTMTATKHPIGIAPVGGTVAAGLWIAEDYVDATVYEPIPIVLHRYATVPQTAWKVAGPSMDLVRIFDGDYVITVPYWVARSSIQDNDIVVVERREAHRYERTCKQIVVQADHYELWPRSTHPAFQSPLILPRRREASTDSEETIEIIGLVIGRHTPM